MGGPFAEDSIVLEYETGAVEATFRFEPNQLPDERWLHRLDDFEPGAARSDIVEEYALPESETYEVVHVDVPAGETLQMGTLADLGDRRGGATLVHLTSRESIPDEWITDRTTLDALLG